MCNQDNSFTLANTHEAMANTHEESSEESSDRTSHENFSTYTETSSSEEDLLTVKRSKRATNSLNDNQMEELT